MKRQLGKFKIISSKICATFTATGHNIVYFVITKCDRQWPSNVFCHASKDSLYMRIENCLLHAKYSFDAKVLRDTVGLSHV